MNLEKWCKDNPDKVVLLREKIGNMSLSRYRRGLRPSRTDSAYLTIATIFEITAGAVTPNDLFELPRKRRSTNGKGARPTA